MITALDTNVLVALWDDDDALNSAALAALDNAFERGGLVISGVVFAELMAFPGRTEKFLDKFLADTQVSVDWAMTEAICRTAGHAFKSYADRRRKQLADGPRRIIADFLIGAHAFENGYGLLTLDYRNFHTSFPKLTIFRV